MEKRNEYALCTIAMATTSEDYACIQGTVVDVRGEAEMVLNWKRK